MQIPISLISALIFAPLSAGYLSTLLFNHRRSIPHLPGLLFHSVVPKPKMNMSHYSTVRFKEFLLCLKKNDYQTLTLNQAVQQLNHANGKKCLITFDDGMECVYTQALPLLREFNFSSTIFCIAGFTGQSSSWDIFDGQKHMSKQQIRGLSDSGHEIGSHTLTHANLTFLNDRDLEKELKDSKKILEDITGKEINTISFPYGSWNEHVWRKALESGYVSATLYRNHHPISSGLFPVYGVYRFDKPSDIMNRLQKRRFSASIATAILMSHFSKGTPVVKFRKNYVIRRNGFLS
ncbi:MAG: polysaccharide deacetylase family protein [Fibrobacter sp.]|jgi:peptidoglycan/xylan/chitin deacetylase (PgdA/CDA1 family)|nr:polysaccharide deacetylase family protein [Fibrobacter sp.]